MYLSIYSVTSLDFLSPGFLKVVKYRYYRYLNLHIGVLVQILGILLQDTK